MSSVTIAMLPDTERKLRQKAVPVGLTLESYLGQLAENEASNGIPERKATFDEIVAPVRNAFQESGMTDNDITDLIQEAREEVWQEKQPVILCAAENDTIGAPPNGKAKGVVGVS